MHAVTLAPLLLFSHVCCSPNREWKSEADKASVVDQIKEGLETFRDVMKTGTDQIPVLDPLELQDVRFDLGNIGAEGSLNVQDFELHNLSEFVVDDIQFSLLTRRLKFVLSFHGLLIHANNLHTDCVVDGQHIQAIGNGSLLTDLRVKGSAKVKVPWSGTLQVQDVHITVQIEKLSSEMEGPAHVDDDLINIDKLFEHLIPIYINNHEKEISDYVDPILEKTVNEALAGVEKTVAWNQYIDLFIEYNMQLGKHL